MSDNIKLALAGLLVVAGIAGYYLLDEQILILRVLAVLIGIGLAVAVAWFTEPGRRFHAFALESIAEARRVSWPSRKEATQTTGIVFLLVVVGALFLWVVDTGLLFLVQRLMGHE